MSNTKKHLTFNSVTLLLVVAMFISLIVFLNKMNTKIDILENKINQLQKNETLVLLQLEDEEKNIQSMRKNISDIDVLINKYSKQYGVDKNLAHAVAKVESGKKQEVVSSSKSIGVFQLQPSTAKSLGVNPYDTEQNIIGGIKYLAYLDKKFNGDTDLILAGYNSGVGNVNKYKGIPPFNETRSYIKKVKKEMNKSNYK